MRIIADVPRVEASDEGAIRAAMAGGAPLIVSGGARDWPARTRWTRDALHHRLGATAIGYRKAPTEVHPTLSAGGGVLLSEDHQASLAELLDLIAVSANIFLDANLVALESRSQPVNPAWAPLRADIVVPDWISPDALDTIGLWLSGRGARTRLHYDRNGRDNFNAQLAGEKAALLVSPDQLPRLRPYKLPGPAFNFAGIGPHDSAGPVESEVEAFAARLEEGDILYIPAFWFHALDHLGEFNFNINFWCDPITLPLNPTSIRQEAARLCELAMQEEVLPHEQRARIFSRLEAASLDWSPARTPARFAS